MSSRDKYELSEHISNNVWQKNQIEWNVRVMKVKIPLVRWTHILNRIYFKIIYKNTCDLNLHLSNIDDYKDS